MPRRLWLLLHEPRAVTAAMIGYWLLVIFIGLSARISPPGTIAHQMGPALTEVWSAALLAGGLFGLIGCAPGWFWVERVGIMFASTGAVMYLAVVLMLHYAEPGSRLVQAGFVLLGISSLVVRWLRIRGAQIDPTRGLKPDEHY